ncbi:uncharacterized protein BJ171DRAFT_168733 [Polychytrium aggregatum]|uniref:uncharacterized protein n=1 Tax=Polychytrium aggregatum TaxID=110093 RepID=UPI0022FEDE89|nr:uncharacterized protein BJ171DRAFT_168733 [Polychytrium aggregatum]KAI9208808.1 hypothetical protein BJ171DRAFT_168733 [Polychytrium aggregatum]
MSLVTTTGSSTQGAYGSRALLALWLSAWVLSRLGIPNLAGVGQRGQRASSAIDIDSRIRVRLESVGNPENAMSACAALPCRAARCDGPREEVK